MMKIPEFNAPLKWITVLTPMGLLWAWEIIEHTKNNHLEVSFFVELIVITASWIIVVNYLFQRLTKSYQELRQSHKELESLRNYNETIIANMPAGIITVDAQGSINTVNAVAEKLFKVSVNGIRGKDVQEILESMERISLSDALQETLVQGKLVEIDRMEFKRENGSKMTLKIKIQPLKERENINGAIIMMEDISKNIELEKQLILSKKLASTSQLISGVAHKIKTPLTSIGVNIRSIKEGLQFHNIPSNDMIKMAEMTDDEINHLNRAIREFLDVAHPTELEKVSCDINLLLDDVLTFLSPGTEEHGIKVFADYDRSLPDFELDRGRIKEVFFNIITNSIEAMPGGGTLSIKTFRDSQFANIRIQDDGCGIDTRDLDRIFDFYFTTKDGGSGIGLSASFLIIDQHGGKITIESYPGKGTTVMIRLPGGKESCHA